MEGKYPRLVRAAVASLRELSAEDWSPPRRRDGSTLKIASTFVVTYIFRLTTPDDTSATPLQLINKP
jgi:hypothetical protein